MACKVKMVQRFSVLKKSTLALLFLFLLNVNNASEYCDNICNSYLSETNVCLSVDEYKLYDLINDYRKEYGLSPIELSKSLSYVAKIHAIDFEEYGDPYNKDCNLHSWSNNGDWEGMCYSDDHKEAEKMWSKPQELTQYESEGYEIAAKSSVDITPELAFKLWKKSKSHDDVMINLRTWADVNWNAIGIGIHNGFACVWFGEEYDLEGEPMACY